MDRYDHIKANDISGCQMNRGQLLANDSDEERGREEEGEREVEAEEETNDRGAVQ